MGGDSCGGMYKFAVSLGAAWTDATCACPAGSSPFVVVMEQEWWFGWVVSWLMLGLVVWLVGGLFG